jgi:hypothetical protein
MKNYLWIALVVIAIISTVGFFVVNNAPKSTSSSSNSSSSSVSSTVSSQSSTPASSVSNSIIANTANSIPSNITSSRATAVASVSVTPTAPTTVSKTFSANGSYNTPGGEEEITVDLTLNGRTITAVKTSAPATNPVSKQYQQKFASGISGQVVGKSIDGLSLGEINGSSLTGEGFNNALNEIRTKI